MRTCLSVLVALLLCLNTAYAAVVGICDTLEHAPGHADHFGHHSHAHDAHDAPATDADASGEAPAANHHHAHVHPAFSSLLSAELGVMPFEGRHALFGLPAPHCDSAPRARLDRPPRAASA